MYLFCCMKFYFRLKHFENLMNLIMVLLFSYINFIFISKTRQGLDEVCYGDLEDRYYRDPLSAQVADYHNLTSVILTLQCYNSKWKTPCPVKLAMFYSMHLLETACCECINIMPMASRTYPFPGQVRNIHIISWASVSKRA